LEIRESQKGKKAPSKRLIPLRRQRIRKDYSMGVFPGLSTGASSMRNASDIIQVIGNNIANTNTPGFKRSRATTSEAFYANLTSALGSKGNTQVGNGANEVIVQKIITQGNTKPTDNPLDVAVEGSGYFVLADPLDPTQQFYTRDGSFSLDSTGTLLHKGTGKNVRAFTVDAAGVATNILANVVIGGIASIGKPTSNVDLIGNLDASAPILGTAGSTTSAAKLDEFVISTGVNEKIIFETGASGLLTVDLVTDGGLISGTAVTGAALGNAVKTALEAQNGNSDTYTVDYSQDEDKFTITNNSVNANSLTFRHSNAASTASKTLGFLAVDSAEIGTGGNQRSDVGVAFNVLTGVNDTLTATIDGTAVSVTIPAGNYTGQELAFQIEKQISAVSSALRGTTVNYNTKGATDKFKITGPKTGGAYNINQPSNAGVPTIAVAAASTVVTGGTLGTTTALTGGTALVGTGLFDVNDAVATSTGNISIDVFDDQGGTHALQMFLRKTGENLWEWHAALKGSNLVGNTADDKLEEVASGLIRFTPDGKLESEEVTAGTGPFNFDPQVPGGIAPTANQAITFNFGTSTDAEAGTGDDGMVQFSSSSDTSIDYNDTATGQAFQTRLVRVDGIKRGDFDFISINTNGDINATFTNGSTESIGRLALALFAADDSLDAIGNNLFKETAASGIPILANPDTLGAGRILPEALEASNTDLAEEFVELILAQQIFQANARIVTVSDQILESITRM
jgi:flagellar hook protein FlgE